MKLTLVGILSILLIAETKSEDQPQWGTAWERNMVSHETGLPEYI
jgi:hypothetical protein